MWKRDKGEQWKRGSSVVSALASGARGPGSLPFVSFELEGMT